MFRGVSKKVKNLFLEWEIFENQIYY